MSEKRFELAYEQGDWWVVRDGNITLWKEEVVDLLNKMSDEIEEVGISIKLFEDDVQIKDKRIEEQQAIITALKERLYDFEKRKIIEESEINEDVIPKVKLLRTELFGEKYE